jgi:O-succinylbenzoate synthase
MGTTACGRLRAGGGIGTPRRDVERRSPERVVRPTATLAAMRLDVIEVRLLRLPMRGPFRSAHGEVGSRDVVVVRLAGPDGEGWGECAALPAPTYTSEFAAAAFAVLRDHLAPRLLDAPEVSAARAGDVVAGIVGHGMAKAALELALLDLEGRSSGQPLATRLTAAPRTTVPAGAAIGIADPPDLAAEAQELVEAGYGRLKVKIEPGRDLEPLRTVRDAVGPDVLLVADANGAYRLDRSGLPHDAARLAALDDLGLTAIEQPLAAGSLDDLARLANELATPIALDESLTSLARLQLALELGACRVVCVKAPLIGGWLAASRALDTCARRGVDAYVGGMLDGGIGRAATLALAAHPGATLPGDQSASRRTFLDDVVAPLDVEGAPGAGQVAVPTGAGLGVEIDPAAVERLTVAHSTLTAR